ncbi:hypothetical protein AOLI_G00084950 [Acnodon oligacanthus]
MSFDKLTSIYHREPTTIATSIFLHLWVSGLWGVCVVRDTYAWTCLSCKGAHASFSLEHWDTESTYLTCRCFFLPYQPPPYQPTHQTPDRERRQLQDRVREQERERTGASARKGGGKTDRASEIKPVIRIQDKTGWTQGLSVMLCISNIHERPGLSISNARGPADVLGECCRSTEAEKKLEEKGRLRELTGEIQGGVG